MKETLPGATICTRSFTLLMRMVTSETAERSAGERSSKAIESSLTLSVTPSRVTVGYEK